MNLFYSHNVNVENAYIITIKGNETSEKYSNVCQQSCKNIDMPYTVWDAFNGTKNPIIVPEHSKNSDIIDSLKITNHYLTRTEVCCFLSHISLWIRCVKIDQPIVILEHDAIMIRKFTQMKKLNSIVWLGSMEWNRINPIPLHGTDGPNNHFIARAHAYALDPMAAKNLLSYVVNNGINTSADCFIRADLFNISHQGLYATDHIIPEIHKTTITNRIKEGEIKKRNDNLEF